MAKPAIEMSEPSEEFWLFGYGFEPFPLKNVESSV